ncbi:hypothetical protein HZB78_00525 [Candidatus Collierbacteria bacterium]|nr:hypothetical protein [Candidatus Collierbacteria bacterium]
MKNIVDRLVNIGNINCDELADILPLVVRVIPEISSGSTELECQPHSGEHSRYGVFFHAITNESDLDRFSGDRQKIVLSTSDLFANTGISGELKSAGVLVFPSNKYQNELSRAGGTGESHCLGEQIGVDRNIQEEHITIDLAGVAYGSFPILSIPQRILIPVGLMKR